jgi:hypothetical protein
MKLCPRKKNMRMTFFLIGDGSEIKNKKIENEVLLEVFNCQK